MQRDRDKPAPPCPRLRMPHQDTTHTLATIGFFNDERLHDGFAWLFQRGSFKNLQQARNAPVHFCDGKIMIGERADTIQAIRQLGELDLVTKLSQQDADRRKIRPTSMANKHGRAARPIRKATEPYDTMMAAKVGNGSEAGFRPVADQRPSLVSSARPRCPPMDGHTTTSIPVRGCSIAVMRGGAGRPLLILHGANDAGSWLPCMAELAARHQVIVPEHPGYGASDTPDWLDTIPDLANFYLDFLGELDLTGVDLVGFCLGGWIAAELAVRNTRRLASLTLVGAAGIHLKGAAQVDPFLRTDEQRIRDLFHDPQRGDAMVKRLRELEDIGLKNQTTTARLTWQPRGYDPQLQKWLHRIDVPTLLVWGANDRLYPPEYALAYQRLIPGAK